MMDPMNLLAAPKTSGDHLCFLSEAKGNRDAIKSDSKSPGHAGLDAESLTHFVLLVDWGVLQHL